MLWPRAGTRFWCSTTSPAASARTWPARSRRARGSPSSTWPTPRRSSRRSRASSPRASSTSRPRSTCGARWRIPGFDARLNVVGTVNVLEARRARWRLAAGLHLHRRRDIWRGRRATDELPFAETARCEPFSVYGQSKLAAEGYVDLYAPHARALRRERFASGTSTGRGRTRPRRPAWWRSSAAWRATAAGPPSSAPASRRATTSTWRTWSMACSPWRAARRAGRSTSGTGVETTVLRARGADRRRCPGATTSSRRSRRRAPGEIERTVLDTKLAAERLGWRAKRTIADGLSETLAAEA